MKTIKDDMPEHVFDTKAYVTLPPRPCCEERHKLAQDLAAERALCDQLAKALEMFMPDEVLIKTMRAVYEANREQCRISILEHIDAGEAALTAYKANRSETK